MANVTSAGSLVCAILEQAGYQAQARLLSDLASSGFFREAGGFLFAIAAASAVVSVATLGSYKAARYLILGPTLFYFLTVPTETFDGVKWRIGGGVARGYADVRGDTQSLKDVKATLTTAKIQDASSVNGSEIKISKAFAMFVKPINETVRVIVDYMLEDGREGKAGGAAEDGAYLHFLSKSRAVEYVLTAQAYDAAFIEMFEGDVVTNCNQFFSTSMALTNDNLAPELIARLSSGNAKNMQQMRDKYKQLLL